MQLILHLINQLSEFILLMARLYLFILCLLASSMSFGQSYFQDYYKQVWARSTTYTLAVAEAMPEETYSFRPTDEVFSFQEQMIHLVDNIAFLSEKITGERPDFYGNEEKNKLNKAKTINILTEALNHVQTLITNATHDQLMETITFANTTMPKENIFYLLRDHMAHHRGQAILYLRQCSIAPPRYVGW